MPGYDGGLNIAGFGVVPKQVSGKLTSRLISSSTGSLQNVNVPAWATFALLEVIGPGGSYSSHLGGGGWADDVIVRITDRSQPIRVTINVNASPAFIGDTYIEHNLTGPYMQLRGLRGDYTTGGSNSVYSGGALYNNNNYKATCKYRGGSRDQVSGSKPAEYGNPLATSSGWDTWTGAGRLAQFMQTSAYANTVGIGQGQYASNAVKAGDGAACVTFGEDRDQLVEFLNGHYKELWGVDWRDIPPSVATGSLFL